MSIDLPTDPAITVVEMRTSYMWLGEDDLVRVIHKPHSAMALRDALEILHTYDQLIGGSPALWLVDISEAHSASREFRAHMSGPAAERAMCALALLSNSAVSRIVGNFYLTLNQPRFPAKLFTDEAKALAWLNTFLE